MLLQLLSAECCLFIKQKKSTVINENDNDMGCQLVTRDKRRVKSIYTSQINETPTAAIWILINVHIKVFTDTHVGLNIC